MNLTGALMISTREREVWTHDNKRLLDRLAVMLQSAEVTLGLRCRRAGCPDPRITMVRDDTDPAGRVLRCGCKDRHVEPRVPRGRMH
jgi:hypothetical protein